ncbi:hypothetical protein HWV62_31499 [Athelia sp. TMB]|nr:hypothetical protein HWV62_31499 [Athelia sp. TMB]
MMDTAMFPDGFHPVNTARTKDFSGDAKYYTRTQRRPKYYFIDFGMSCRYKNRSERGPYAKGRGPTDVVMVPSTMMQSARCDVRVLWAMAAHDVARTWPTSFFSALAGTLTPLLGIGVCVSIQFGVLEYAKRQFAAQNISRGTGEVDGKVLTAGQLMAAGVMAGLANGSDKNKLYKGPFDAMKKFYSAHGIAGIYKGQGVTLLRETTGYAVYFLAYEKLMQREMAQKGIKREEISASHAVLYGATAGYVLWAVIYPIDMIKSRIQTDVFSPSTGQKYKSALDCVRTVWRSDGIGAFTRGLGPTLIRWGINNMYTIFLFFVIRCLASILGIWSFFPDTLPNPYKLRPTLLWSLLFISTIESIFYMLFKHNVNMGLYGTIWQALKDILRALKNVLSAMVESPDRAPDTSDVPVLANLPVVPVNASDTTVGNAPNNEPASQNPPPPYQAAVNSLTGLTKEDLSISYLNIV